MSDFPISILIQQEHPTIKIQEDPEVIIVNYRCRQGDPGTAGEDGVTPDLTDPTEIQKIMEALAGEITATELHQDLLTRINKIDLGSNSLEAQAALLQYGLEQINQSFGVVSGRLADAEGAITVHDGQITALGVDLATLDGTAQGHASLIESLDTRVTVTESDIESQATSITGLGSRVSAAEGSIVGQAAIINSLSTDVSYVEGQMTSLATSVSTIQSSVNNNTAAIQQEATTRASQTGDLYAKYSVKVDVNGKISGFGLQSTDVASLFEIRADRFAICNTSGSGTDFPFIVDGGIVYIDDAMIKNLSASKITAGTITAALSIQSPTITGATIQAVSLQSENTIYVYQSGYTYSSSPSLITMNVSGGSSALIMKESGSTVFSFSAAGLHSYQSYIGHASISFDGYASYLGGRFSGGTYDVYLQHSTVGPFTGSHDALIEKGSLAVIGDIIVDTDDITIKKDINNTIHSCALPQIACDKKVIGVLSRVVTLDEHQPTSMGESEVNTYKDLWNIAIVNAIGEGQINVCKDGGNIEIGDYIVSSARPGKGMKQSDDILRNFTVAKARESCSWDASDDSIKMISCSYHCG